MIAPADCARGGRRVPRATAEIGIVGAGPAGARAAELLAGLGAEVICFDPQAPWEKPCGGGLPAAAFRHVPELAEVRPLARRIERVRLEAHGRSIVLPLDEPLYVVSRRDLGEWQIDRTRAAGAELVQARIVGIARLDRGWVLQDDAGCEYRVRRLVGADGAASRVRSAVAPALRPELAAARVAYPTRSASAEADEVLFSFFDEVPGYMWDFPRPDHRSVGVAVVGSWGRSRLDGMLLEHLASAGNGDGGTDAPRIAGAAVTTAKYLRRKYRLLAGPEYALLGDAAGLADPATGEGIEYALRSGGLLAESYERERNFSGYPAALRSELEPELRIMRALRGLLYRGRFAERVIGAALRWSWARTTLRTAIDACNEHRALLTKRRPPAGLCPGPPLRCWAAAGLEEASSEVTGCEAHGSLDEDSERGVTSMGEESERANQTRRRFINWLLGTSAGGLLASALYPVVRYLVPPAGAEAATNSTTLDIGPADVPPNSGQIFKFGNSPGIVLRTPSGELRAFSAVCTHLACTVQYRADLSHIWCACHNGHYDLNGINIAGPPPRPLDRYSVNVRNDRIVVGKES